jgi:hypothetical protein
MTNAKHSVFIRDKKKKTRCRRHLRTLQPTGKRLVITVWRVMAWMARIRGCLLQRAVQSYSDGQLKWMIENGISPSGMPSSKGILDDEEIWSTVLFIRHLPPMGSVGEPEKYGK